ncbi:MAG: cupin domain-containing protein [Candidatus Hydrothermarchaeota archaeon]
MAMEVFNVQDRKRYSNTGMVSELLSKTARSEIACMSFEPGQGTGLGSVHPNSDQIIYVVEGEVEAEVQGEKAKGGPGTVVLIPADTRHIIRNVGKGRLLLLSIYTPPAY